MVLFKLNDSRWNGNVVSNINLMGKTKAMKFLEKHPELIKYDALSRNKYAIHILKANPDKINWNAFSRKVDDANFLMDNYSKINWNGLSGNKNDEIYDIIVQNLDKINWHILCTNRSKKIMKYLEEIIEDNIDKVCWYSLEMNPSAINILNKYYDRIDWAANIYYNHMAVDLINKSLQEYANENEVYEQPVCLHPYALSIMIKYDYNKISLYFDSTYGIELKQQKSQVSGL